MTTTEINLSAKRTYEIVCELGKLTELNYMTYRELITIINDYCKLSKKLREVSN